MWVTEHWHGLPRKVMESQSLEILQSHQDMVMGNQLWVVLLEQGVGLGDHLVVPSHLTPSLICS